jgi:hypothetical protein
MKPGDLVKVKEDLWKIAMGNVAAFREETGLILRIEMTPPYLGGDEMYVVLIENSEQSFYPEELEIISEG